MVKRLKKLTNKAFKTKSIKKLVRIESKMLVLNAILDKHLELKDSITILDTAD